MFSVLSVNPARRFDCDPGVIANDCQVSMQRNELALVSSDGMLQFWDTTTLKFKSRIRLMCQHRLQRQPLKTCAYSPDGQSIAFIFQDGCAGLYFFSNSKSCQLNLREDKCPVTSLAFASSGVSIALGYADGTLGICNLKTKAHNFLNITYDQENRTAITALRYSPVKKSDLLIGLADGWLKRLTVDRATHLPKIDVTLMIDNKAMSLCVFSPEGSKVLATTKDNLVMTLLRAGSLATSPQWLVGHVATINTAAFSPDGQRIISGSDDQTLRLWNTATGHTQAVLTGHTGSVVSATFSPAGDSIVSTATDGSVCIWDLRHLQS